MQSAIRGYYDGECVRLLDRMSLKKNQRVLVTVMDDSEPVRQTKTKRFSEDADDFRDALLTDRYVMPTDIDADAYIAELRSNDRF